MPQDISRLQNLKEITGQIVKVTMTVTLCHMQKGNNFKAESNHSEMLDVENEV